jgi:hypothetical protein
MERRKEKDIKPVRWGVLDVVQHFIIRLYIPTRDLPFVKRGVIALRKPETER